MVRMGFAGNTNANVSGRSWCVIYTKSQSSVAVRMQAVTLLSHAMSADPTLGANVSVTVTLSAGAQTMSSVPKQCRASSEIGGWWPKQWDASSTEGTGSAAQTRDNVLKEANHFCRLFNEYSAF